MIEHSERKVIFKSEKHNFEWIDIVYPSREILEELAVQYGIHATSIEDCLDPEHLPKIEIIGNILFIIARAYDYECSDESDTVQELTRKVAIFVGDNFIITIHRKQQPYLTNLAKEWIIKSNVDELDRTYLLISLIHATIKSYDKTLQSCDAMVDRFEIRIFSDSTDSKIIKDLYFFKRKVTVMKKMLRQTSDILKNLDSIVKEKPPIYQDMKETLDEYLFLLDELIEDVNNLINVHLSLASHRTNEVVRVLTVFSVFFLPITFIAGLYGMNFKVMPELELQYGYPMSIGMMLLVSLGIYTWFRRKGLI